jgi:hypothetical protein
MEITLVLVEVVELQQQEEMLLDQLLQVQMELQVQVEMVQEQQLIILLLLEHQVQVHH